MWNKINGWTIIFFLLLSFNGYSQSPLCASYPTTFCCEYVASITINGQTYACLLVLCDGGIATGHPVLIEKA